LSPPRHTIHSFHLLHSILPTAFVSNIP
jgi:hypothetical protein